MEGRITREPCPGMDGSRVLLLSCHKTPAWILSFHFVHSSTHPLRIATAHLQPRHSPRRSVLLVLHSHMGGLLQAPAPMLGPRPRERPLGGVVLPSVRHRDDIPGSREEDGESGEARTDEEQLLMVGTSFEVGGLVCARFQVFGEAHGVGDSLAIAVMASLLTWDCCPSSVVASALPLRIDCARGSGCRGECSVRCHD